jgi:hypothetical protein
MKSDIVKRQEILEDDQKYATFLEIIMPDDVEDPSQFCDVLQKMINCLKKLRRGIFA